MLLAKSLDPRANLLAAAEIYGRLLAEPDSWRSSGQNDVARLETHESTERAHEKGNAKHHGARRAVLPNLAHARSETRVPSGPASPG